LNIYFLIANFQQLQYGLSYIENKRAVFRCKPAHKKRIVTFLIFGNLLLLSSTLLDLGEYYLLLVYGVTTIQSYKVFVLDKYLNSFRGAGAPGFFFFWVNFSVLLTLGSSLFQPDIEIAVVYFLTVEVGMIFIVSGIYKLFNGYLSGVGIEVGLSNPMWSHFPKFAIWTKPKSVFIIIMNHISVWGEIIGGLLLIYPPSRLFGALLLSALFIGIFFLSRLGTLCFYILIAVNWPLLVEADLQLDNPFGIQLDADQTLYFLGLIFINTISGFCYLVLFFNFFGFRFFPRVIKQFVSIYTRFTGQILWRVFTHDITGIYCEVMNPNGKLLTPWGRLRSPRFRNVIEAIRNVSVFTTLRYYTEESDFRARICSYSSSLPLGNFEYLDFNVFTLHTNSMIGRNSFELGNVFRVYPSLGIVQEIYRDITKDVRILPSRSRIRRTNFSFSYDDCP
jgi:hypothetical protein